MPEMPEKNEGKGGTKVNLLEQYIVEIHSVKPCTDEWTEKFEDDFVTVDITTNCYGSKRRHSPIFSVTDWERYKEQGYYMG